MRISDWSSDVCASDLPGSTDGSRDIIAELGDGIDTVILDPDRGPADGLNKGFAAATGRVGYFINSDDFLVPGAVAALRRQWAAPTGIGLLLGRGWRVREDEIGRASCRERGCQYG